MERANTYLHWQCIDVSQDPDIWLRYYATPEERSAWQREFGEEPPPSQSPPYPRRMPRRPI